jgi:hypothetical protein
MEFVKQAQTLIKITGRKVHPESPYLSTGLPTLLKQLVSRSVRSHILTVRKQGRQIASRKWFSRNAI